jgi:hypothetical protein
VILEAASTIAGLGVVGASIGYWGLRTKGLHRWLLQYIRTRHLRREWNPDEPLTVYFLLCDHYEPKRGNVSMKTARSRVQEWVDKYPKLFDGIRDSEGRPPQHTFFYPEDEYEPELVDMVAELCRKGYGDVEIHLHHDNDTAEGLRDKLMTFKEHLYHRHGLLRLDQKGGITYGFIHGNWALDNSRSDGRHCGVNNELDVLVETGCYADFTMPSAPSETQTKQINTLYWAKGQPGRSKAHNWGVPLGQGPKPDKALLMVPGPLLLDWSQRKLGILPGIENGNIQKNQPPTEKRFGLWLRSWIELPHTTNCVVVKLHTHGCNEPNQDVLLGEEMVKFHSYLTHLSTRSTKVLYSSCFGFVNKVLQFDS